MGRRQLTVNWRVLWAAGLILLLSAPIVRAAELDTALASLTVNELRQHVSVLASDTFEGREAGNRGGRAAGVYLLEALQEYDLVPAGENGSFFQEFGSNYRNVLAVLPGGDPQLRGEYILIGAHYDHVGYGSTRNSLGPVGRIHNGADDNASGTAALLELIEALASVDERPRRSILFAFWDAEEQGLLGSEHWVNHPTVPLRQVRLMINVDMIGRLRNARLEVYGTRTAPGLRRFISLQNRETDLNLDFDWSMLRDSDHYPFYRRGIPCLMLHTGKHDDYHRPTDDTDTVNFDGLQQVSRLLLRLTHAAAETDRLPTFRSEVYTEDAGLKARLEAPLPSLRPRLGVGWDDELARERIIQLTHVAPDSAADRAGLRRGDRILRFGRFDVSGAEDFRSLVLAAESPVEVVVQRHGVERPELLTIQLDGRPVRLGISWRIDPGEPAAVIVCRVVAGSPAHRASLRVGDRVYQVNDEGFASDRQFRERIAQAAESLDLIVERHGRIRALTLDLLSRRREPRPTARESGVLRHSVRID